MSGAQLAELEMREDVFDDFCLAPFHPRELEARLRHLHWRTGRTTRPEIVEYGDLVLNLETYQAAMGGRPLDLTYMEYELLRFFATHPGKVFTREQLLSRVWGYEYYGGARTVDVHVRRLRAKLGEERRRADPDGAVGRLPVRPVPLAARWGRRAGPVGATLVGPDERVELRPQAAGQHGRPRGVR